MYYHNFLLPGATAACVISSVKGTPKEITAFGRSLQLFDEPLEATESRQSV